MPWRSRRLGTMDSFRSRWDCIVDRPCRHCPATVAGPMARRPLRGRAPASARGGAGPVSGGRLSGRPARSLARPRPAPGSRTRGGPPGRSPGRRTAGQRFGPARDLSRARPTPAGARPGWPAESAVPASAEEREVRRQARPPGPSPTAARGARSPRSPVLLGRASSEVGRAVPAWSGASPDPGPRSMPGGRTAGSPDGPAPMTTASSAEAGSSRAGSGPGPRRTARGPPGRRDGRGPRDRSSRLVISRPCAGPEPSPPDQGLHGVARAGQVPSVAGGRRPRPRRPANDRRTGDPGGHSGPAISTDERSLASFATTTRPRLRGTLPSPGFAGDSALRSEPANAFARSAPRPVRRRLLAGPRWLRPRRRRRRPRGRPSPSRAARTPG
jgi:hypothetical protein